MVYIAKLITVAKFKNITDKLKPFVYFHSELMNVEITDDDKIIMLQIEGTESYFPIFLNKRPTIQQIESKLAEQDTRLNSETRKLLLEYLDEG